jgi:hypothetical protein
MREEFCRGFIFCKRHGNSKKKGVLSNTLAENLKNKDTILLLVITPTTAKQRGVGSFLPTLKYDLSVRLKDPTPQANNHPMTLESSDD